MAELDRVEQLGERPADFGPVGILLSSARVSALRSSAACGFIAQFGEARAAQQWLQSATFRSAVL